MKINNRGEIRIAMYLFFFIILLDIAYLIVGEKIWAISPLILYSTFSIIFIFTIYKLMTLKIFSMEVSEHIISVKYMHPLLKKRHPVLEVPLHKVVALRTTKGIITYILTISINTKRGIKNFYYNIGQLPENQIEKFRAISDFVKTFHEQNRSELKTAF